MKLRKTLGIIPIILLLLALLSTSPVRAQTTVMVDIAKQLMCSCGCGLVLATCDCDLPDGAAEMKALIEQKLAQGQSKQEIIAFFVDRYGEQVLASPKLTSSFPKQNSSPVLWSVALIAIMTVGTVIYLTRKKRGRREIGMGLKKKRTGRKSIWD